MHGKNWMNFIVQKWEKNFIVVLQFYKWCEMDWNYDTLLLRLRKLFVKIQNEKQEKKCVNQIKSEGRSFIYRSKWFVDVSKKIWSMIESLS